MTVDYLLNQGTSSKPKGNQNNCASEQQPEYF